jgi:hypothetical protein
MGRRDCESSRVRRSDVRFIYMYRRKSSRVIGASRMTSCVLNGSKQDSRFGFLVEGRVLSEAAQRRGATGGARVQKQPQRPDTPSWLCFNRRDTIENNPVPFTLTRVFNLGIFIRVHTILWYYRAPHDTVSVTRQFGDPHSRCRRLPLFLCFLK